MNTQNIVVALIVLAALFYVGSMVWRKVKSFSSKNTACGNDCGCSGTSKNKIAKI